MDSKIVKLNCLTLGKRFEMSLFKKKNGSVPLRLFSTLHFLQLFVLIKWFACICKKKKKKKYSYRYLYHTISLCEEDENDPAPLMRSHLFQKDSPVA